MRHAVFGLVIAMAAAPASALTIGVFGGDNGTADGIAEMFSAQGHAAAAHEWTELSDGALLGTLDVIVSLRVAINQSVADRVEAGALLITEWDASDSTLNSFFLLDAADTGGDMIATGTTITLTAEGLAAGFGADLPSGAWSDGGATEFFRTFGAIGPSVEVLATRPGDIPVLLGGSFGAGRVLIAGWDWGDQSYGAKITTGNERFLINAVGYGAELAPEDPGAVVPLAAAAPLLAVGLAALAGLARRRRRA